MWLIAAYAALTLSIGAPLLTRSARSLGVCTILGLVLLTGAVAHLRWTSRSPAASYGFGMLLAMCSLLFCVGIVARLMAHVSGAWRLR